jgi:hypothetical protein
MMNHRVPGLLFCLGLASCVSASGIGNRAMRIEHPDPSPFRGEFIGWGVDRPVFTAESFLAAWGAPDDVMQDDDSTEVWRYDLGLRWNGVWGFFIVLPWGFFVPTGCDSVTLRVEAGEVVEARTLVGGAETWHWHLGLPCGCSDPFMGTGTRRVRFEGMPFVEDE